MVHEFMAWWGAQLLSVVPARFRGGGAQADAVALALVNTTGGAPALDLTLRQRGRDGVPARFPLTAPGLQGLRSAIGGRAAAATLVLPPGQVLEQSVVLPLAAERDPERVLRYEMDRLTPFQAADLFWTWRVVRRDRARNQLHLAVSLAVQAALRPVLGPLAEAGIRPARLQSGATTIPLDRAPARPWRRRVDLGLAALCALLVLALAAAPFVRQSLAARATERRIAAARPAVDQAEALRRRAAAIAAGVDVLAAQRATSGSALDIIAAITAALPDDTSLSDLAVRARAITLSGQSAAAARLISALAGDPALRDTSFAAPVTRNDTTRTEGFTIRTEMAP